MEHHLELRKLIKSSTKELGLTIDEIQVDQFIHYLTHLIEWSHVTNITAIVDPNEIVIKHFIDSLTALVAADFPKNTHVLDVGSGAGFPGIPLKIMRSDIRLVLVEPVQKKCSFINSVIGLLKLQDVSTFNGTLEKYAKWPLRQTIDSIVVRALKYEEIRLQIPQLLTPNGKIILYKTNPLGSELIGEGFHILNERIFVLPRGSGKRVVSVIERDT